MSLPSVEYCREGELEEWRRDEEVNIRRREDLEERESGSVSDAWECARWDSPRADPEWHESKMAVKRQPAGNGFTMISCMS